MMKTIREIQYTETQKVVSPLIFGSNLEHTRNSVHHGISAQMLENRKFAGKSTCMEGCAPLWLPVGAKAFFAQDAPYTRHAEGYCMNRALECNALSMTSYTEGEVYGIRQNGLWLEKGRKYIFSIAIRALQDCVLKVSFWDGDEERSSAEIQIEGDQDYAEKETELESAIDSHNAGIRITCTGPGSVTIGAVSLMPSDHYHGMRVDVIERMKEMGIRILRWPGGNFAGEYNWKDGLLISNMRAPLQSYLGLETQPHSMGYDFHEINTDDFVALCRAIGAEPFITINPTWNTPEETAQWVEYCNGDANTEYGRLRMERGYEEPYHVKFWSLGNEFGYGHMEGTNTPADYAAHVRKQAEAMLKVDPELILCSSGPYPNADWAEHSARDLEDITALVSLHHYSGYPTFKDPAQYKSEYEAFLETVQQMRRLARQLRDDLKDSKLQISFDEWNSWYAWYRPESVCDGIFAAAALHMFMNEAGRSDMGVVCHFEAVNEGPIIADGTKARLTPMGQMFALMKQHADGRILYADDMVVVTEKEGQVTATLLNTSYDEMCDYKLPVVGTSVQGICYTSESILPHSTFETVDAQMQKAADSVTVTVPPHSIVWIQMR